MVHETIQGTFRQTNLTKESAEYLAKREDLRLAEIENRGAIPYAAMSVVSSTYRRSAVRPSGAHLAGVARSTSRGSDRRAARNAC